MGTRAIWKYGIEVSRDAFAVEIPRDAYLLCVQTQSCSPVMWWSVDPRSEKVKRTFRIIGTGEEFERSEVGAYYGTFQLFNGDLVFHLFEDGRSGS